MDALLQIVVPEISQISGIKISQPMYEWDGIEYPQGPQVLSWNDLELTIDEKTLSIYKDLPQSFLLDDWVWLKVSDKTLDDYENWVNSDREDFEPSRLEVFLSRFLSDVDHWVLAFILHWDQIDHAYHLSVEDCVSKLNLNLIRENKREGFIAYS